ncbi:MAG: ComF family protein [Lachnospiraceae bacterium]|nr:ComF family protein [Lachnospiraceae bacterium]
MKDSQKPPFICDGCFRKLVFPEQPRCMCCSKPLEEEDEFCEDCRGRKRQFDQGWGMLLHDDATRKILYDLKFHNRRDNADFVGHAMAGYFAEQLKNWKVQALIPVPLHKKRQKRRGYNQAELIAKKMAFWLEQAGLEIPVDRELLVRRNSTLPQRKLNLASRAKNMHNAFSVTEGKKYKTVVLIDDIFTSGSTLDECARTLKQAGIQRVYFLTASIV